MLRCANSLGEGVEWCAKENTAPQMIHIPLLSLLALSRPSRPTKERLQSDQNCYPPSLTARAVAFEDLERVGGILEGKSHAAEQQILEAIAVDVDGDDFVGPADLTREREGRGCEYRHWCSPAQPAA